MSTIKGFIFLISVIIYSSESIAGTLLFTSDSSSRNQSSSSQVNIQLNQKLMRQLGRNSSVDIKLPTGELVSAVMIKSLAANNDRQDATSDQTSTDILLLNNHAGSLELVKSDEKVSAMKLIDTENEKIYHAKLDDDGNGQLIQQDINDHYCVDYPQTSSRISQGQLAGASQAATPDLSTLQNLQSRPNSANVLYVNFWGGTLSDTYWNANYTNNSPINYTPYDIDANPGNFSSTERDLMWLAWREAVEDFAPFDINITTSSNVYNATPINQRTQMIVTTTESWYPGNAGGVALLGIFDSDSDYHKTAWTWNLNDISMGMTISHEAGHQLGLHHDGAGVVTYYSGHGSWGPIMGAPFGKRYVQWSKGEYPSANQTEDDINIINNYLPLIVDDAGDSFSNAKNLTLPVNNDVQLAGFNDIDIYSFTLNDAQSTQIKVIPLIGDEDLDRGGNLAFNVSLSRITASGTLISEIASINSSDISPLLPSSNKFEFTNTLAAGIYALSVTPTSPDLNWATGFGEYANAGEYRLSVNASGGGINMIGEPTINRASESGVFIWRDASEHTYLKVVAGGADQNGEFTNFAGSLIAEQTITSLTPISLEFGNLSRHDELNQISTNQVEFEMFVARPYQDSFSFIADTTQSLCLELDSLAGGLFLGPDKIEVSPPYDINLFTDCSNSILQTIGEPSINNSVDDGIFIWQNSGGKWFVKVVSGNGSSIIDVNVTSEQSLTQYEAIRLEVSDIVNVQAQSIDASLTVGPPGQDGFKFRIKTNSNTCLSTNSSKPIYVGPGKKLFNGNFNLNTLQNCQ